MEHFIQEFRTDTAWLPDWLVSIGVLDRRLPDRRPDGPPHRLPLLSRGWWRSATYSGGRWCRAAGGLCGSAIMTWTLVAWGDLRAVDDREPGRASSVTCAAAGVHRWCSAGPPKTALHIWMTVYQRRFKLDAEDNLLARAHVTQTRIAERIASAS
jgi:hypothetical protein